MIDEMGGGGMSRPPVTPPQLPTLSSIPMGGGGGAGGSEGAPGGPGKGQAVMKIFFILGQQLDTLASVAPGQSEAIDQIKTRLKDVMTAVIQGAAQGGSRPMMPTQGGSADSA